MKKKCSKKLLEKDKNFMKNKTFDYSNLNNSFRLKRANSVSSLNSFSIQYNGITEKGRKKETIYFISYPGNPVFGQLWCRKTSNPIFSARYYFPVFRFPSEATHFLFHFPSKAKPEGKGNKAKSLPQPENESLTTKLVV